MSLPTLADYDLLLAVRDHAPAAIAEAEQEAADLRAKADAATARANRLKALLDAAKEGA